MKKSVENFIVYAEKEKLPIESLTLSDKDGVILEHTFSKEPKIIRNIYSHTKSFVSTLIGVLYSEGKIKLDDKIMSFFSEYRNQINNPDLEKITVRHLLTMSSGFGEALLMQDQRKKGIGYPDFVHFVLSHPLKYEPGSQFTYSNGDTYLLGKIIEKITKKTLQAYAYETLLKDMDIDYPVWECDPQGCAFGASGLFLSCKDMNKLGILYLNKGVLKNKKILSDEWLDLVFHSQIVPSDKKWDSGYSFKFWKNPNDKGFRADGAWGQITHIFLKEGYALSYQSPENGNPELVREELFKFLFEGK